MEVLIPAMSVLISIKGIAIYCVTLLVAAVFTFIRFRLRVDPLVAEIEQAVIEVNKSERDKEAFPEYFEDLKEWMDKSQYLRDSWREFEETLLFPGADYDDDREIILNTRPTGSFFNQRNILWHKVNMRFYNAFPNFLTGVGILGTFLGLVAGISLAAPGLNSDHISAAKQSLSLLLDGASLAFVTSICGLGASLLFSWLEKKRIHDFEKHCFILVSDIDARVEYFSAERLASKALQESKKQSDSMQTFANDLAVSLAELIETKVTEPIVKAVSGVEESQRKASDETLERLIREFSESIAGAAGEEMKAFATTIEAMNENISKVSDKLISAAEKSAQQMEKAATSFDSVLDKLSSTIAEVGDIEEATKQLLEGFDKILSGTTLAVESTREVGEHLSATSTKMESTADKILQSTDKVLDASDKVDSLVGRLDSMNKDLKALWESYHDRFESADESVASLFKNLQDGLANYAQSTNDYVIGLDKHAAKVVQELASATQELSQTVEEISASMDEQRSMLAERGNTLASAEGARA